MARGVRTFEWLAATGAVSRELGITPEITVPALLASEQAALTPQVVVHVTREYGAAWTSGIGVVVNALAKYQVRRGVRVVVVLPHYALLDVEGEAPTGATSVNVPFCLPRSTAGGGKCETLTVPVGLRLDHQVLVATVGRPDTSTGTGATMAAALLARAFQVSDRHAIYAADGTTDGELALAMFAAAVAEVVELVRAGELAGPVSRVDVDGAPGTQRRVVVHVHGAGVGLAPLFLGPPGSDRPAVVYSLHDYWAETTSRVPIAATAAFRDIPASAVAAALSSSAAAAPLMSTLGIAGADMVLLPSRTVARALLGDRDNVFPPDAPPPEALKCLLRATARDGRVAAVPHGVDREVHSPYLDRRLLQSHLHFDWFLTIAERKSKNKQWLCRQGIVRRALCYEPLVVYLGALTPAKGVRHLIAVAEALQLADVSFIVMTVADTATPPAATTSRAALLATQAARELRNLGAYVMTDDYVRNVRRRPGREGASEDYGGRLTARAGRAGRSATRRCGGDRACVRVARTRA